MVFDKNLYARLGVPKDASQGEIQRAYHQAARKLHPDVNDDLGATELFISLQEAYDVLSNSQKRAEYDQSLNIDQEERPPIILRTTYSRSSITRLEEPQLHYSLLDIEIQREEKSTTQPGTPLNIALVLDKSTSMKGKRINILKSTAIELIRVLNKQDIISIIAFNDWADVLLPAGSRIERSKIESNIHKVIAEGGTEIFKGLESGLVEVRRFLNSRYINHIVLITDGRSYGDEEKCLDLADQALAMGISISTLGIGGEYNDEFLDELAKRTGGSSKFISNPQHIRPWLKDKLRGLGQAYVERVKLHYQNIPGIHLRCALRVRPEVSIFTTSSPIHMGNFFGDSRQSILFEFQLDSTKDSNDPIELMDGDLTFDIPTREIPSYRIPISMSCPISSKPTSDVIPREIVHAVSRLTYYRMQDVARNNIRKGNIEDGKNVLKHLATQLLQDGNHQLANTVQSEIKNIHQQGSFSKDGDKIIKYGTRALLLPGNKNG